MQPIWNLRHKGQVQGQKHTTTEALRSVQSDSGATKALRVEAFRYVISRMLLHSIYPHLSFFSQCRKMRRLRREFPCVSKHQPVVSELMQSNAIMAKAIQMVRLVLPLSFFFMRGEEEKPTKGFLQNLSPPLIFF